MDNPKFNENNNSIKVINEHKNYLEDNKNEDKIYKSKSIKFINATNNLDENENSNKDQKKDSKDEKHVCRSGGGRVLRRAGVCTGSGGAVEAGAEEVVGAFRKEPDRQRHV